MIMSNINVMGGGTSLLLLRRRMMMGDEKYAVTRKSNAPIMDAFWNAYGTNGTIEAGRLSNPNHITMREALTFTGTDLNPTGTPSGSIFYAQRSKITHFEELEFFENITTLPAYTFYSCSLLTNVGSTHVISFANNAIDTCRAMEEAYFPEVIIDVSSNFAFMHNCPGRLTIKGVRGTKTWYFSVSTLRFTAATSEISGFSTGYNTSTIKKFEVDPNNPNFTTDLDGLLLVDKNKTEVIRAANPVIDKLTVPSYLTVLKTRSFSNCNNIKNLIIPESVSSLGSSSLRLDGVGKRESLTFLSPTPIRISSWEVINGNYTPIYVPDDAVDIYKSASIYTRLAEYIMPLSERPF